MLFNTFDDNKCLSNIVCICIALWMLYSLDSKKAHIRHMEQKETINITYYVYENSLLKNWNWFIVCNIGLVSMPNLIDILQDF